ncbi:hypothetical protein [Pseudogemmobacter faecipullorum]|uniref:Uncharacterized protein n=1 Tax=Pseudogemmobacter faecipullorum TaxID=2755041 RepID=A0ABS8CN22_9RHOB|nr:hypothetical protein [Pseudogemmobacter faecipullorum]
MSEALALYGTSSPVPEARLIRHGALSLVLQDGALRHIRLGEVEMIRQIAFLARDRDWGTLVPQVSEARQTGTDDQLELQYQLSFSNGDARLATQISLVLAPNRLQIHASGRVEGRFETNRAGFTLLHPIEGVAGAPARLTRSDGSVTAGAFPWRIAPWQPFMDIAALEHEANGLRLHCAFAGDVFEMEDQRQWGDASFKTYNRPLALPWPYHLEPGEALEQSITLSWEAAPARPAQAMRPPLPPGLRLPELALVVTAEEARHPLALPALERVRPQRLLCHLDATSGPEIAAQALAFADLQRHAPGAACDLELICRFDRRQSPDAELAAHAAAIRASGLIPASVFVCAAADRQSTPPGSAWPDCPPAAEIQRATARHFGDLPRGGGMASFFPELNRKPEVAADPDFAFITHGLCPIIHAADDLSLFETLEALPHIAASARAIAGQRGYRIGPSSIAMRQNPYGSRVMPNPGPGRVPMAGDDPRHRAAAGAAYAFGLITALLPFGISCWTPAALLGPRGVMQQEGDDWPLTRLLAELARLAGREVTRAEILNGMAWLEFGPVRLRANLRPQPQEGLAAFAWERLG